MARWILNPVALYRATCKLGIKAPVSVTPWISTYWAGVHEWQPLHLLRINHRIDMHAYNSPSWTIWHELGHALQCERDFNGDGEKFAQASDAEYAQLVSKTGKPIQTGLDEDEWSDLYFQIKWEAEAEDIARRYANKYPLVRITT